jgi:HAD superfamily hydrolase (TIGR01509 family)
MMPEAAPCLALDIGGVCLRIEESRCLSALGLPPDAPVPDAFRMACARFETGDCREDQWLAVFRDITGHRFGDNELRSAFCSILGPPMPGMAEWLAAAVAAGIRLVFFSDTSELHLREVFRRYAVAPLVAGAVVSYEVGAHKPAPAMYEAFERDFGRPALYLDDRPGNIAAGLARGWPAVQFTSVEALPPAPWTRR